MTFRSTPALAVLLSLCASALLAQDEDPLALALDEDDSLVVAPAPAPAAPVAAPAVAPAPVPAGPTVREAFADLLLSDLRGARWLVAEPGPLADSVEARAAATGVPLRVLRIDAVGGEGPELSDEEAAAFAPRTRAACDLAATAFVLAWLWDDPEAACSNVVLAACPTLPEVAGFAAVPDGAFFRIVRDEAEAFYDPAPLLVRHDAWRDEAGEILSRDPDGRETADERAHVSRLDNELGVCLVRHGRRPFTSALGAFRAAHAASPGAVSPLLNLASMARDGFVANGESRARVAAALDAAVSRTAPDRLWSLAVCDGRVLRPSDFLGAGWSWALSGCLRDDTNSLAVAFAGLPDGDARRALVARLQPGIIRRDGSSHGWAAFLASPEMKDGWNQETALTAARRMFDGGLRQRALALLARVARLPGADPADMLFARLEFAARTGDLSLLGEARAAAAACADPAERLRRRLALVAAIVEAQGEFPQLQAEAEAALAEAGDAAPAWLAPVARAAAALARRDPLVARAELAGVSEDDSEAWPALRLLLLCELFTSGTGDTHAETVLRFRPRDYLAHYVLGNRANVIEHDPAAAITHLQASVAERPTWMALNDLASLLAEHGGNPRLGEAMARDALRMTGGKMPSIHDTLGETLMAQGRAEDAAGAFRAALRVAESEPGSPTALFHLHLGEALLASGDALGALDEISAADTRVSELGDDVASVLRLENLRHRAEAALPAAQ